MCVTFYCVIVFCGPLIHMYYTSKLILGFTCVKCVCFVGIWWEVFHDFFEHTHVEEELGMMYHLDLLSFSVSLKFKCNTKFLLSGQREL